MLGKRFFQVTTAAAALLLFSAGCKDPNAPAEVTAPSDIAALGVSADAGSADSVDQKAVHDSLMAVLKQVRDSLKAESERHRGEFEQASQQWHARQKVWKHGNSGPALLTCAPQPFAADAELIGPDGGTIKIGPHELKIPKGALDHWVIITGVAPVSNDVEVQFQPEGLQFARGSLLKLNYSQCVEPPSWLNMFIVYLGDDNQVLQILQSRDKKGLKEVDSDIHHFSRYAVAW